MGAVWRSFVARVAPGGHSGGWALVRAAAVALASALFWGLATRLPFVAVVTFLTQVFFAWCTPRGEERLASRIGTAFMAGGMWAAIGMLVAGR